MRYFIKLNDTNGYFEEVDEYTFKNAKYALTDDETQSRYTDDYVIEHDGYIDMRMFNCPVRDIAILHRLLQATIPVEKVEGGFVRQPQMIKFRKRNSISIREMLTGKLYKAA